MSAVRSRRRSSGTLLETTTDAFAQHVVMDDGIPMLTDDVVSDAQTQGAASTCSSIYAVRFGMEGVMGLQTSERPVVEVGDLETKDAGRWRCWTQSPTDRAAVDGQGQRPDRS